MDNQIDPTHDALWQIGAALSRIEDLLHKGLQRGEREPDYDQTFVVGGTMSGDDVYPISLPRTVRHVQVDLSIDYGVGGTYPLTVVLFRGNVTSDQAQAQYGIYSSPIGVSNAICSSSGGQITARAYLDQSGYLTVFFPGSPSGSGGFATVRVRSLDPRQDRTQGLD